MTTRRFAPAGIFLALALLASGCASATLGGRDGASRAWSFEEPPGTEWSTNRTFDLGSNRILGLFNDENPRYPTAASLRLSDIPAGASVTLSFDLYFVGTWDSSGNLADRWGLEIKGGETLLEMTEFNYAYRNGEKARPQGKRGSLDTGKRILQYWIVTHEFTIPPDRIQDGSLTLLFRGDLTGRGTEFWALDDVRVSVKL